MSGRQDYVVHTTGTARPALAGVCTAVYDTVADRTELARVDAFSDYHDEMPEDIRAVQAWLRELSARQSKRGTGMGVRIRPSESPGWDFARAYTPWSIHVELYDATQTSIATFHDCGYSIIVSLNDIEAGVLAAALPAGHALEPLIDGVTNRRTTVSETEPKRARLSWLGRLRRR